MYPPLRSKRHIDAVLQAIQDDTIDCFTTDHAPHTEPDKLKSFQDAANGFVGLETSFAVMNTYLVKAGYIELKKWIEKMTYAPAKIIRIDEKKWHLSLWADADISIFDPNEEWIVDEKKFFSKGKNSPFIGKTLQGKTVYTIVGGRVKYKQWTIIS